MKTALETYRPGYKECAQMLNARKRCNAPEKNNDDARKKTNRNACACKEIAHYSRCKLFRSESIWPTLTEKKQPNHLITSACLVCRSFNRKYCTSYVNHRHMTQSVTITAENDSAHCTQLCFCACACMCRTSIPIVLVMMRPEKSFGISTLRNG